MTISVAHRPTINVPHIRVGSSGAKPRILIASGSVYQMGGMERIMQTVAREVVRYGFETEVAIPRQAMAGQIQAWFKQYGATVVVSDELTRMSDDGWRAIPALARYFKSRNVSLVNLHSPGPHIPLGEVLAVRMAGLPVVTSIHGYDASNQTTPSVRLRNRVLSSRLNSAIIVMNETVRLQQVRKGVSPRKLELVYNAVVPPDGSLTRVQAREQLGLPEDAFVTVSFCRMVRDKGVDVLIRAVDELPDELLDRSVMFLGGIGPELESLKAQVSDRGRKVIRFLGHVDDPSPYYAAADVLVAPSRHEPFGLVFLEAGQYGLPAIGTHVGGIPEVISSGETGLLVEPENPRQLTESIVELSRSPELRHAMGERAKQRVRARYSVEALVEGYARVFERALGRQALSAYAVDTAPERGTCPPA